MGTSLFDSTGVNKWQEIKTVFQFWGETYRILGTLVHTTLLNNKSSINSLTAMVVREDHLFNELHGTVVSHHFFPFTEFDTR